MLQERLVLPEQFRKFSIVTDTEEFKKNLAQFEINGLALDIDETLSCTILYWVQELKTKFGSPDLTIEQIIKTYRYAQEVPDWQSQEALEWMQWARNSNEVQLNLPLIEGSNEYVEKIDAVSPISLYLTVRPTCVCEGTIMWLKDHSFPPASIIARPENMDYSQGNEWKAKILEVLYPQIKGIVDDNPGLIKYLSPDYKGIVYLYGSGDYSDKPPFVVPCSNWQTVFREVESRF